MADVVDSFSEAGYTGYVAVNNTVNAFGQAFTCGGDYELDSVRFYLQKVGAPAGSCYAELWSMTGTYGSNGVPNALLATSDAVAESGISTSFGLITFTFSGAERVSIASGYYCIVFRSQGGDSSHYIRIGIGSASGHNGNSCREVSGTWGQYAADTIFYVYGETGVEQICTESITVSGSALKTPGVVKVESITLVATAVKGLTRVWSETVSLGALLAKAPGKVLAEALSLVDTFSKLLTKGKELLETITLVDTVNKGITRLFTQAVAIGGAVVKAASKTFSEVLSVGEVLEKFKAAIKNLTETISVTDTLTKAANKVLSETVTLVDSITRGITKVYSETVTLVETLIKQSFLYKVFTETITLTDSITSAISKMWVKVSKSTTTYSKQTKPTSVWTKQAKAPTSFTKTGR